MNQEAKPLIAENERFLSFSLGNENYAIPLLTVKEVIAVPEITPVPFSPEYFVGIMNLRGQVISVVDLRRKLNIKPRPGAETAIVICDLAEISLGIVVDSINSVLSPKVDEISEKPEVQAGKSVEFITAIYRSEGRLTAFLDVARTLNLDDHHAVAAASKMKAA